MAEIKSAVEIAMERTRGLRLSAEEKENLREEEIQNKARALVNRFLEAGLSFREVEKDLNKYPPAERIRLEKFMIRDLAGALNLDRNNELVFQGIEILAPEKKGLVPKIKELTEEYQRQEEAARRKTGDFLRVRWQSLGISGAAVVPKVAGTPEWAAALKAFRPASEARLQALKDQIR